MKIDRFQLIEADNKDGSLDGRLTKEELHGLDPSFAEEAERAGLTGPDGSLAYAPYLDRFAEGARVWEGLGTTLESVPLVDALLLGKKTEELQKKVSIHFKDNYSTLKDRMTLLVEINRIVMPGFLDLNAGTLFFNDLKSPVAPDDLNPSAAKIFRHAAGRYLDNIRSYFKKPITPDQINRVMAIGDALWIDHSNQEKEEIINAVAAGLVYRAVYFFPRLEDRLWGNAIHTVGLSFVHYESNGVRAESRNPNPFDAPDQDLPAGMYESKWQNMDLHVPSIVFDKAKSGGAHSKYDQYDPLLHEMTHAVFEMTGDTKRFGEYFANLTMNEYGVIFGRLYGNKEAMSHVNDEKHLNPINEAHSVLAELTGVGDCFPEAVERNFRESFLPKGEIATSVATVGAKLDEFRKTIREEWGYRGHPPWAVGMQAFCQALVSKTANR